MIRFFNPGASYLEMKEQIDSEMQRVLSAGDLILRDDVEKFEKSLADYVGTKYAVALNSCTDALYLSLRALHVGYGDEVLVPSRTFVATAQVVVQVGANPVFYDRDDILHITEKTRAIIPVHIEGEIDSVFNKIDPKKMPLNKVGQKIYMVEDAAQALGASWNGKMAGSFGEAGCFSFYPAKILGAYGDAGALTTNNEELYKWIKGARNHFKEDASDWGVNSRMDNLQAAILNVKFPLLQSALQRRKEIAEMYDFMLCTVKGLHLPPHTKGRVWQDYIVRTTLRNKLYEYLKKVGIETMKNNYPFPVPKLPLAQAYEDETLRLPCNETINDENVKQVVIEIRGFFDEKT
jgi:dTDP-4-amino-4,6-dideoxygalactose transaminase